MTSNLSSEHGLAQLPAHVHGFALVHRAMRRDARRLAAAAPVAPGPHLDRVRGWWRQVRSVIEWHHRTEDDILWPALRARVPGFAGEEARMHADHAALDEAMSAVTSALAAGDRARLRAAAAGFDETVRAHLRAEEALVLPAFCGGVPVEEYTALERRVIGSAPLPLLAFLAPWMLDEADTAGSAMPPPVRLMGGTVLRWNYHRQWRWW